MRVGYITCFYGILRESKKKINTYQTHGRIFPVANKGKAGGNNPDDAKLLTVNTVPPLVDRHKDVHTS